MPVDKTKNKKHRGLRFLDLIRLSLRSFKSKPSRTFLTVLGMSVGIGAVLFLVSLGHGLQYILVGRLVSTEDSLISMEVLYPPETGLDISMQDVASIAYLDSVSEVSPVSENTGEVRYGEANGLAVIKIIEPNYSRLSGERVIAGENFSEDGGDNGIIISSSILKLLGLLPADFDLNQMPIGFLDKFLGTKVDINLFVQNQGDLLVNNVVEFPRQKPIIGIIIDDLQPPFLYALRSQTYFSPTYYKKLFVKANSAKIISEVRDELIDKGFLISARIDLVNQATKVMSVITIVLAIFGITALVVAAVGMFNTMLISFLERIFEVGIIKALGATNSDVRNIFLVESLIMGFLGGLGGILLGMGGAELINLLVNILAKKFGGASLDLFITPPWFLILIVSVSVMIGVVSGFLPARKATKLSPKEAFTKR